MPSLTLGNNRVRYRHSPGPDPMSPTVLLLHMAGSSSLAWSPVVPRLADVAEVVAPDLPGHGQSDGEPLETIDQMANFALEFLDAFGVVAAHVAGHSMGGGVALSMALRAPSRVRSLVLVSTAARLGVAPAIFEMIDNHFEEMAGFLSVGTPIFPQTDQRGVRRDFEACAQLDIQHRLGEIQCPCAVLVGRDDPLTPPRWSEQLAGGLPRARLQVEEGCGHLLLRERPGLVVEAVRELISAVAHGAGGSKEA